MDRAVHNSAEHAVIGPAPPTAMTRDNSPWTSGQSAVHPAVHHRSQLTGDLFTTADLLYITDIIAGENPVAYTN